MQHSDGLGSFFSSLARKAMKFIMSGLKLVAPHPKKAAKGVAQDVIGHAVKRFSSDTPKPQPPMVYKRKNHHKPGIVKRRRQQATPDFLGS